MATDLYKPTYYGLLKGAAVVPNDVIDLPVTARALWIGTAGNLTVIMAGDNDATHTVISNVPAGLLRDLYVRRVLTATTASGIVAFT